ncbi:uncharacterized protein LOC144705859 [Wolffia australiana]
MAASSATSAAINGCISRPVCLESSKLLFGGSCFCPRPGGLRTSPRRLQAETLRRNLPVIKAKKQTFHSFDDLLENSDKPVLVDFYATWCGPCQYMVPVLNEVSTQLKDKINVVKIDTEKYPAIASRYGVEALPTFIIFRNGKPYDRFEGALPVNQLLERIEYALNDA